MATNLLLKKRELPKVPLHPKELLPTMCDLPSENPEEPGLPDDLHYHQPQLLRETFCPVSYSPDQFFVGSDLNIYYDVSQHDWYKRPDWFAVLGVPPFPKELKARKSYVIWQEEVIPFVVVELLSESTKKEDLGKTTQQDEEKPPTKWEVYEQWLQIPYYVVFDCYNSEKFQAFRLIQGRYHELILPRKQLWFSEITLGLGLWTGNFHGLEHQWLRWYDANGKWISTPVEKEQKRTKKAEKRAATEAKARQLEKQRADAEAKRAATEAKARQLEKQRADIEAKRAEEAEAELVRLKALLAKKV